MIKDNGKSLTLYSKDGNKVLMIVNYTTELGKKRAKSKIEKHEKEIEYFKRK